MNRDPKLVYFRRNRDRYWLGAVVPLLGAVFFSFVYFWEGGGALYAASALFSLAVCVASVWRIRALSLASTQLDAVVDDSSRFRSARH